MMQVTQESLNLYRLTRLNMFNCFLVREDDGATLVDTNIHGSANPISQIAHRLGWSIRRILLTHAHFDHVASLDKLSELLPEAEVLIGEREARLLAGDFSLEPSERGRPLHGFPSVKTKPTRKLKDGDSIGSLRAISSPGHTPGHFSYLDTRDNTLIAGDTFMNQAIGLVAAGVFKWYFPMPYLFSWNAALCVASAAKLRDLRPPRLAMGHGNTLQHPASALDHAVATALKQHPQKLVA
jgi:glyoxylase-like metal-dependent hydrolase (beta-lactamase superfamily II)